MTNIAVCMLECVILCMRRVTEHVDIMWSHMGGVEMNETLEHINGGLQCVGQGPWAKHTCLNI